jgi:tetratricopeptide (TPR) repeat protein
MSFRVASVLVERVVSVSTQRMIMLGSPHLKPSGFARPKALAFLAYLLLEGRQTRQKLAELFWEPHTSRSDNSLRNQISRLKNMVPLVVQNHLIGFDAPSDIAEFQHHLDQGEDLAAVRLYAGEFLAGFVAPKDSQLEEWLFTTRQFIKRQVLEAHLRLWRANHDQVLLNRAHAVLLETDHKLRAWWMQQLERPIHKARNNLPNHPTVLFGRNHEKELVLERLLGTDNAQMVSLVGLGGVGKTRLALEVAHEALYHTQFMGGVFFVALETVLSADEMLWRIATAVEVGLQAQPSPIEQIAAAIQQPTLMVLDNLEQVAEAADCLHHLLETTQQLRLLCTSREVLGLQAEHVYPLGGLEPSAAQALLLARAPQAQTDLESVAALCELLHGIPLALELAAGQLTGQSPQAVLARLQQSMETLVVSSHDLPERQRSLRVVFEHSWSLLAAAERQGLERMALFRGGAQRGALLAVAELSLSVLARLIDASLVQRVGQRYTIHPLILEFVTQVLSSNPEFVVLRQRHARHFLDSTALALQHIRSPEAVRVMQHLEPELDNLGVAWTWAIEQRHHASLVALEEMVVFFDRKGIWQHGIEFFRQALESHPDTVDAVAVLQIGVAWLSYRLEKFEAAIEAANQVLKLKMVTTVHRSKALNTLASVYSHLEQNKEAILTYLQILELPISKQREILILTNLAQIYIDVGYIEHWRTTLSKAKSLLALSEVQSLESEVNICLCEASGCIKLNAEVSEEFVINLLEVYRHSRVVMNSTDVYFELYLATFALAQNKQTSFLHFINLFFLHSQERQFLPLIASAYIQVALYLEPLQKEDSKIVLANALWLASTIGQKSIFLRAALAYIDLDNVCCNHLVLDGLRTQAIQNSWQAQKIMNLQQQMTDTTATKSVSTFETAQLLLVEYTKNLRSAVVIRAIPNIFWVNQ